jgi:hypothetical protein
MRALSAGDEPKYEKVETALADRRQVPMTDIACRVTAATAIAILKLATRAWLAGDDAGPDIFGSAAFGALRRIVGEIDMPRGAS